MTSLQANPNIDFIFQLDSPARLFKFFALKPWDSAAAKCGSGAEYGSGRSDAGFRYSTISSWRSRRPCRQQFRRARSVRHQHDRILRPAEHGCAGLHGRSAQDRAVPVLSRHRSEDRPAAGIGGNRSRQDGADGPVDERCRQRAFGDAGRRLCQLFQHGGPFLPRDGPGGSALPAESVAVARLLHSRAERRPGAAFNHRAHQQQHDAGIAGSFPAAEFRHDQRDGGSRHDPGRHAAASAADCRAHAAAGLHHRLRRHVAAIHSGNQRFSARCWDLRPSSFFSRWPLCSKASARH